MKTIYETWGEHVVKLTWLPNMEVQNHHVITSVHAVCIEHGKILLSSINNRGFNIPGGHIDAGETIEQALHREVYEEAYIKGKGTYIGCLQVSHQENPHFNPNGKYPIIAYQAFYRMDITECLPFLREFEAISRIWVEPSELVFVINDHELITEIVAAAINQKSEVNSK